MESIKILIEILDGRDFCEIEKNDSNGNCISVTVKKNQSLNSQKSKSVLIDIIPDIWCGRIQYLFNQFDTKWITEIRKYLN